MDRDHRRGFGPEPRLDIGEIEGHRLGIAVDEDDPRSRVDCGCRRREERVRGNDHFAALDLERAQDDLERAGAGADGHGVLRGVPLGERSFELVADRPQGELAGGESLIDPGEDLGAVFGREPHPGGRDAHEGRIYRRKVLAGRI